MAALIGKVSHVNSIIIIHVLEILVIDFYALNLIRL